MTLSSSKLELIDRCEGAFSLPWRDETNVHSEAGTERHAVDESAINAGNVPDEYTERWPGLTWRAENAYMYDVATDTSRYLGCGIGRAYGEQRPFEVPGTIDVEGRAPGVLVVIDKKGFEVQQPASTHPQVRFLALAAARVLPADQIFVAIRPELGTMDVAEVDPVFDLDVIAHEVKQRVIRAAAIRGEVRAGRPVAFNVGRWCRWCPAFDSCPKQKELRALVQLDDAHPDLALQTFVDDQSAADVYALWKRIGILHKRIGQQLYSHAATRPIPLHNGKAFGPYQKLGDREYDGPTVHAVIAANPQLGRDVADKVVEMTASQAQFSRVVKPLVQRGKFEATKKAVFDEVEARGKMTRKLTTTIEEYDPKPALVTDDDPAPVLCESPF